MKLASAATTLALFAAPIVVLGDPCFLGDPCSSSWQNGADYIGGGGLYKESQGALVGDVFYMISSEGEVDTYEPEVNTWFALSTLPTNTDALQVVALNDSVHVIYVDKADPTNNELKHIVMTPGENPYTWNDATVFEHGGSSNFGFGGAVVTVGNKIYVFGRNLFSGIYSDAIHVYDGSFTTLDTNMVAERAWHTATLVGTKVYIIGGATSCVDVISMEVFDTETSVSSVDEIDQNNIPFAKISYHMTVTIEDMIYVIGGLQVSQYRQALPSCEAGAAISDKVWRYNPAEDEWSEMPSLPLPRRQSAAFTYGREIFVVGGMGLGGWGTSSTFRLDIGPPPSESSTQVMNSTKMTNGAYRPLTLWTMTHPLLSVRQIV